MCVKDIDHKSKNNIEIVPRVISHGYGDGFLSNYIWDGCRDYSSILALPLLLEFWNSYNLTSIRQYQHDTLHTLQSTALYFKISQNSQL